MTRNWSEQYGYLSMGITRLATYAIISLMHFINTMSSRTIADVCHDGSGRSSKYRGWLGSLDSHSIGWLFGLLCFVCFDVCSRSFADVQSRTSESSTVFRSTTFQWFSRACFSETLGLLFWRGVVCGGKLPLFKYSSISRSIQQYKTIVQCLTYIKCCLQFAPPCPAPASPSWASSYAVPLGRHVSNTHLSIDEHRELRCTARTDQPHSQTCPNRSRRSSWCPPSYVWSFSKLPCLRPGFPIFYP